MRNIFKRLSLCLLALLPFFLVSCERKIIEGEDFISGKWRTPEVINQQGVPNYKYRDHISFSPYDYSYAKRKMITYAYDSDSTFEFTMGHYTIKSDTLIIVDHMERTLTYFIDGIKNDSLKYHDSRGNDYVLIRFKGPNSIPATPEVQ